MCIIIATVSLCIPLQLTAASPIDSSSIQPAHFTIDKLSQNDNLIKSIVNDYFASRIIDNVASLVVSKLSDPTNLDEERKYIKVARMILEAIMDNTDSYSDSSYQNIIRMLIMFLLSMERKIKTDNNESDTITLANY